MDRRGFIASAVSAALAPSAFARPFGSVSNGGSGGGTFDYYISPTGSDSNAGTLASPWSLNSLQGYALSGAPHTNWLAMAGKRTGLIGDQGAYNPATQWSQAITYYNSVMDTIGQGCTCLSLYGGGAGQSYLGSSDSSGNEVPRLAVLDFHTTQAAITGISVGSTTTITTNAVAGSNPYSTSNRVCLYGLTGTIAAALNSVGVTGVASTVLIPTAVGGSSGAYTFTLAVNTTGLTWSGGGTASTGYQTTEMGGIGQALYSIPSGHFGNATIHGLTVMGVACGEGGAIHFFCPTGSFGGTNGIVVEFSEVVDAYSSAAGSNNVSAIRFQGTTGAVARGNKLHDIIYGNNDPNIACILTFSCDGNLYEGNTTYNSAIGIYDKAGPAGGSTIRFNICANHPYANFRDCHDSGSSNTGKSVTAYNNILLVSNVAWDGENTNSPYVVTIRNNTTYGSFSAGGGIGVWTFGTGVSPTATVTHYDNVYYATGSIAYLGQFAANTNNSALLLSDYNLYQGSGNQLAACSTGSPGSPTAESLASWKSATSMDTHSAASNASFVGGTFDVMHPNSFALTAGTAGSSSGSSPGSTDGTTGGSATDMGAWGGITPPGTNSPTGTVGCGY